MVVVVVLVVAVVVEVQRVSWYWVTPTALYWLSRLLRSVWIQQPAELPPDASQSTATQSELATQAAWHATRVVMLSSLDAPTELTLTNDRHGTHSPDVVAVVVAA